MQPKTLKPSNDQSKIKGKVIDRGVHSSHLMELFENQLKDILWAEKALIKAIPKMITLATSTELTFALTDHLKETHEQITRLARVFRTID